MKYLLSMLVVFSATFFLSSCFTTKAGEKAAYINNDELLIPGEKITAVSMFAIPMPGDKPIYEKITSELQSFLSKKNISSDMRFFDPTENPATIGTEMRQSKTAYYLVLDKIKSGTQKDELGADFIINQLPVYIQKNSGEHIANFVIAIDRITRSSKLGQQIADLITGYLSKKNLL